MTIYLESKCTRAGQHRAHRLAWFICRLTLDIGLGTRGALCCRTGGARLGLWTLHHRATRARARGAIANLARLRACADARRAVGYTRLKYILGHIRLRGAFRLQHILTHIWHRRARRDGGLEDPFARVWLLAGRARWRRLRLRLWGWASARGLLAPRAQLIVIIIVESL